MSNIGNIPNNVMNGIQKMFACNGFDEEFVCFLENYNDLKECTFFMYSDNEGEDFPEVFKSNFDKDFAIVEIGCSDKYYMIDEKVCQDMIRDKVAYYDMDFCVELDTQAVSYLKNMFKDFDDVNIPQDKQELFFYLNQKHVNYSSIPYILENAGKKDSNKSKDIYLNLKSYEIFKHFDFITYQKTGEIKYDLDESNILLSVDDAYNRIVSNYWNEVMRSTFQVQKALYCLLIEAALIEFQNSKKSAPNKMRMLIDFILSKFGVFSEREMIICYRYFEHDERTKKFFKKVHKDSKDLKKTLNGMAWDLTHVRTVEKFYVLKPIETCKLAIHPILTYDNGLKEVLKLCPVKKIVVYNDIVIPCLKNTFYELMPEASDLMFKPEIMEQRKSIFDKLDFDQLVSEMEEKLDRVLDAV